MEQSVWTEPELGRLLDALLIVHPNLRVLRPLRLRSHSVFDLDPTGLAAPLRFYEVTGSSSMVYFRRSELVIRSAGSWWLVSAQYVDDAPLDPQPSISAPLTAYLCPPLDGTWEWTPSSPDEVMMPMGALAEEQAKGFFGEIALSEALRPLALKVDRMEPPRRDALLALLSHVAFWSASKHVWVEPCVGLDPIPSHIRADLESPGDDTWSEWGSGWEENGSLFIGRRRFRELTHASGSRSALVHSGYQHDGESGGETTMLAHVCLCFDESDTAPKGAPSPASWWLERTILWRRKQNGIAIS